MRSSQLKYNFNNIQSHQARQSWKTFELNNLACWITGCYEQHLLKASKRYSQLELFLIAIQYVTPSRKGGGVTTLKIGNPKICNIMYKFNHINFADLALWHLHIQLYHQRRCNRNISSLKQRTIIWPYISQDHKHRVYLSLWMSVSLVTLKALWLGLQPSNVTKH